MKRAVQILVAVQVIGFAIIAFGSAGGGSDAAGRAMTEAFLLLGGLVLLVFLLPALLMAPHPRTEKFALVLALVPLGVAAVMLDTLF